MKSSVLPASVPISPNSSPTRVAGLLHYGAAVVLLLFAGSHFAALYYGDLSHAHQSTVFPFLTIKTLLFIAGLLEIFAAALAWRFRGQDPANWVILTFVAIIVWYRFAFHFTGGVQCGCTGVLGRLLHFSRMQEKAAPIITLAFLTMTTFPWLWHNLKNRFNIGLGVAVSLIFFGNQASAEQIIEISGKYEYQDYNTGTGKPYPNQKGAASFTAILAGNTWKISATNLNDPKKWDQLLFDGTNTYTLSPYEGHFGGDSKKEKNLVYATVSASAAYIPSVKHVAGIYMPWLAYGLIPDLIPKSSAGTIAIPLPWQIPRVAPTAFGYAWNIVPTHDKRFVESLQVVRDRTLDKASEREEYLRPEFNYPDDLVTKNLFREALQIRHQTPAGFIPAKYKCLELLRTNNVTVPSVCELEVYTDLSHRDSPSHKVRLEASKIKVSSGGRLQLSAPNDAPTLVEDYRYRQDSDDRVFAYAEYTLLPGESWKSAEDPTLLNDRIEYLKNGPQIDKIDIVHLKKNVLVWVILGAIILLPVLALLWKSRNTLNNKST